MAIVGEAFIAIKPDTKTFERETERAVTREMSDVAKKAADAFEKSFQPDVERVAKEIFDDAALRREGQKAGEGLAESIDRAFALGFKFDAEGRLRDEQRKIVALGDDIGSDLGKAIEDAVKRADVRQASESLVRDIERAVRGFDPPNIEDRIQDALPSHAEAERLGRRVGDGIGDGIAKEVDDTNVRGKVGAGFGRLAGFAAAAFTSSIVAAGLGAGIVKAVDAASDLGEAQNKTNVVFGASADQVSAFADTAAESLGIAESKALEFSGTFGNLLRSVGLTEEKSADMSTTLVGLAADLGSFNNLEVDDVLEKLRAGLTGEAEPLKVLGVNLNEATLKAKALQLGLLAGVQDADKVEAANKKVADATAALADAMAGADPEKVAKAQRAVETAQNGVTKAIEAQRRKQEDLTKAIEADGAGSQRAVRASFDLEQAKLAVAAAEQKVTDARSAADRVAAGGGPGSAAAKKAQEDLDEAQKGLEASLEGKVPATLDAATKAQAAYALILEQTALAQNDFARTAAESLPNQIKILKSSLTDGLADLGTTLVPVALGVVKDLVGAIGPAFEEIGPVLGGLVSELAPVLSQALGSIADILPDVLAGLSPIIQGIGEVFRLIGPDIAQIIGTIAGTLGPALGGLISDIAPFLNTLAGGFALLLDAVGPAATQIFAAFGRVFQTIADVLAESDIRDALADIAGVVGTVLSTAVRHLEPVLSALAGVFGGVLNRVLPIVAKLFERLAPVVEQVADVFLEVFDEVFPIVARNLDTFLDALEPVLLQLGDSFLEVIEELAPHIPQLAEAFAQMAISFSEILVSLTPLLPPLADFISFFARNVTANAVILVAEAMTLLANVMADIVGVIGDVIGGIAIFTTSLDQADDVAKRVLGAIGGFFTGLWDTASGVVEDIIAAVLGIPERIAGIPAQLAGLFVDVGKSILSGIFDGLEQATDFATDVAKTIGNAIIDFLNQHVIGAINDLLEFEVPLPLGRKITVNPPDLPNIPQLAGGGVISPVPGGTLVNAAEAGQREVVAPLSPALEAGFAAIAAGKVGGDRIQIVVQGGPSNVQTAREIVLGLRGERWRRGKA